MKACALERYDFFCGDKISLFFDIASQLPFIVKDFLFSLLFLLRHIVFPFPFSLFPFPFSRG